MSLKSTIYQILLFAFMGISSCRNPKVENIQQNLSVLENKIIEPIDSIVIDCDYSFEEAVAESKAPQNIIEQLTLIHVQYYSFDSLLHQGQIVCHQSIADDLTEIFDFIRDSRFPIAKVIPIVKYNDNDLLSMNDNNTYCFCYRNVSYSKHAIGKAIDINPMQNPLRWKEGYQHRKNLPENATYNPKAPGTFLPQHPVVLKFQEKGFRWGRFFRRNHDDHHFEI